MLQCVTLFNSAKHGESIRVCLVASEIPGKAEKRERQAVRAETEREHLSTGGLSTEPEQVKSWD